MNVKKISLFVKSLLFLGKDKLNIAKESTTFMMKNAVNLVNKIFISGINILSIKIFANTQRDRKSKKAEKEILIILLLFFNKINTESEKFITNAKIKRISLNFRSKIICGFKVYGFYLN